MVAKNKDYTVQPDRIAGLAPVVGHRPRVLILGSMPSTRSLEESQYYAHPRNAFWPIMDALGLASASSPYGERLAQIMTGGVALWDSLRTCARRGSLDAAIDPSTEEENYIASLLTRHPTIAAVFFNGAKAEETFRSYVLPTLDPEIADRLSFERLPSTSPTHAIPFARKLTAWRTILRHLPRTTAD